MMILTPSYFPLIFRPLHLAAPLGMMDVVETLLAKGASVAAVDGRGLSPPLSCAANEDVAMCLAMILSVFLATPANSEARRSICSLSSMRLSDLSFSSRLSEVSDGDGTFTVGSNDNHIDGDLSQAVAADPSTTTNTAIASNGPTPTPTMPTKATTLPQNDINLKDIHNRMINNNITNGTTTADPDI